MAKTVTITWLVLSSEGEYLSAHEDPTDYCKAMRQLLEAISTRERLRAFWQRNLVTIAMLRRNLPNLKSDKGEHYAEILTTLYKQQMRVVWEEAKAYEQRARMLASEGGGANARRQKAQGQATHDSPLRPHETTRRSLEQYKDSAERSAEVSGAKTAQPNDQQLDDGEGDVSSLATRMGVPPSRRQPLARTGTKSEEWRTRLTEGSKRQMRAALIRLA